jgi:peptidoglycan/LPS O-acetylase OafA/YrhL
MAPAHAEPPGSGARAIPALTGVRFVFALAVVLYHLSLPGGAMDGIGLPHWPLFVRQVVAAGYIGVQCFFVLSGFILAHTYAGLSPERAREFYRARFARVYPVFLLGVVLSFPSWPAVGWWSLPLWLLLLQGWMSTTVSGNGPDWSLSVEAFFYALFPAFLRRFERCSGAQLWAGAGGAWAVSLAVGAAYSAVPGTSLCGATADQGLALDYSGTTRLLLFSPLAHLPEFVLGICACLLLKRGAIPARVVAWAAWVAPAAMVAVCGLGLGWLPLGMVFVGLLAPGCAGLVVGLTGTGWPARVLGSRPLVRLGEASYALYVLHLPLHWYVGWVNGHVLRWGWNSAGYLALNLAVMLAVSLVVFRWYEEPLRRWIRRPGGREGRWWWVRVGIAGTGIVGVAMAVGVAGLVERARGMAAWQAEAARTLPEATTAAPEADAPEVVAWEQAAAAAVPGDEPAPLAGVFGSPGFDEWLLYDRGRPPERVRRFWEAHRETLPAVVAALRRPGLAIGVAPSADGTMPAALLPVHDVGLALQIAARMERDPGPWLDGLDALQAALAAEHSQAQAMQALEVGRLRDQAYLASAIAGRLDRARAAAWMAEPAAQEAWLAEGMAAQRTVARGTGDATIALSLGYWCARDGAWAGWREWVAAPGRWAGTLAALRRGEGLARGQAEDGVEDAEVARGRAAVAQAAGCAAFHRLTRLAASAVAWRREHGGALPAEGALTTVGSELPRLRYRRMGDARCVIDVDPATPWPAGADARGPAARALIMLDWAGGTVGSASAEP